MKLCNSFISSQVTGSGQVYKREDEFRFHTPIWEMVVLRKRKCLFFSKFLPLASVNFTKLLAGNCLLKVRCHTL